MKTILVIPNGCCRFYPSCSVFAKEAIEKESLFRAAILIAKRVFKCNPFYSGGYNPIKEKIIRKVDK
jgi:putative membrane protein insertion efficiency factor